MVAPSIGASIKPFPGWGGERTHLTDTRPEADREAQEDAQRLRELGYRQELSRAWPGFTNFAISFTIISVLAGTFTTFSFAWQNGGGRAGPLCSVRWGALGLMGLLSLVR